MENRTPGTENQYVSENTKNEAVQQQTEAVPSKKRRLGAGGIIGIVAGSLAGLALLGAVGFFLLGANGQKSAYNDAMDAFNSGSYTEAGEMFNELGDYEDSRAMYLESFRQSILSLVENGDINEAYEKIEQTIYDSMNSDIGEDVGEAAQAVCYECAEHMLENGKYNDGARFYDLIPGYIDASFKWGECVFQSGLEAYHAGNYEEAKKLFDSCKGYKESDLYFSMCVIRQVADKSLPAFSQEAEKLFNSLAPFAKDNKDVAELLADPIFFYARMYNASWSYQSYSMNFTPEALRIHLPWKSPSGGTFSCKATDKGLEMILSDGSLWFTITGYSDNTTFRADEMYITACDGKSYTFELHNYR